MGRRCSPASLHQASRSTQPAITTEITKHELRPDTHQSDRHLLRKRSSLDPVDEKAASAVTTATHHLRVGQGDFLLVSVRFAAIFGSFVQQTQNSLPSGTILNDPPSRYNQTDPPNRRATPMPAPRAAIFTRVAIYNRISNDPQGIEAGVERQREDCLALADRLGWQVCETYVDNDLSAWTGKPRPDYRRMLADIRAGKVDAVIVWHEDRLTRLPRVLEEFADACLKAGVHRLVSCYGDTDLSNSDDMLTLRIKGAVAKNQSDAASRRLRRKHLELAQDGRPSGCWRASRCGR